MQRAPSGAHSGGGQQYPVHQFNGDGDEFYGDDDMDYMPPARKKLQGMGGGKERPGGPGPPKRPGTGTSPPPGAGGPSTSPGKGSRSRPTNNQLLYKAYFRWPHYSHKLTVKNANLPFETDACASVTAAFLQVLQIMQTAESLRVGGNKRNVLQILSSNTRRTKVVELSSGTHRVPDELKKHYLSDGEGGQYSTNLDRNRYGNDDNYLFTVIRYDLEFLGLCPCMVDVEIIDAKQVRVRSGAEGAAAAGGMGGEPPVTSPAHADRPERTERPDRPERGGGGATAAAAAAAAAGDMVGGGGGGGGGGGVAAPVAVAAAPRHHGPPGRNKSKLWSLNNLSYGGEVDSLQNALDAFREQGNASIIVSAGTEVCTCQGGPPPEPLDLGLGLGLGMGLGMGAGGAPAPAAPAHMQHHPHLHPHAAAHLPVARAAVSGGATRATSGIKARSLEAAARSVWAPLGGGEGSAFYVEGLGFGDRGNGYRKRAPRSRGKTGPACRAVQ
ncbi:hypothetical protein TSOC_005613 [Tetrabaena socialis]|uniref:Uncharacterized protein n=1 Tax=Tetrabaena socialis TaxID=47790 RepID=A0A2J8A5V7_9CHLO|nr:hypothetical protein TSOC_005613 [Tetrabaena socialis]|eukprot:PNH07885.1 hypothetical protein TSOC_005613 [Tetrabaena socialis]